MIANVRTRVNVSYTTEVQLFWSLYLNYCVIKKSKNVYTERSSNSTNWNCVHIYILFKIDGWEQYCCKYLYNVSALTIVLLSLVKMSIRLFSNNINFYSNQCSCAVLLKQNFIIDKQLLNHVSLECYLTLYQMTNFRLFQTGRVCRWQLQIWWK